MNFFFQIQTCFYLILLLKINLDFFIINLKLIFQKIYPECLSYSFLIHFQNHLKNSFPKIKILLKCKVNCHAMYTFNDIDRYVFKGKSLHKTTVYLTIGFLRFPLKKKATSLHKKQFEDRHRWNF